MALDCFVGAFNIGTATGDVDVTTVGFQPKCVIFWWTGQTANTDRVGEGATGAGTAIVMGCGFAVSTTPSTGQRASAIFDLDGAAAADTDCCHINGVICSSSGAGAFTGKATLTSFLSNGFRVNVSDAFPSSMRIGFMALGGSDITDLAVHDIAEPAATGNVGYTLSPAFQPDFLFFIGTQNTTAADAAQINDSSFMLGWAKGTGTADQRVMLGSSDEASGTMDTDGYGADTDCLGMIVVAGGNMNALARLNSFDASGFTLNWTARAVTNRRYHALAIKGPQFAVGSVTLSSTLNADLVASGFGFQPKGAFVAGMCSPPDAGGATAIGWVESIGAFDDASHEHAQGMRNQTGLANATLTSMVEHDEVIALIDGSSAGAIQALAGLQSVDADGFTLNMDDADTGNTKVVGYWAIGPAAAAGTQFTQGVSGTVTTAGALSKETRTSKAGTLTSSGALFRQVRTAKAGTLSTAGALFRQTRRAIAGTVASTGALVASRLYSRSLAGTVTSSGTVVRQARHPVGGTLGAAGALERRTSRALAGTLSSSGALQAVRTVLQALVGTLSLAGALTRQARTSKAGTLATAGTLTKRTARALAGTVASSGTLVAVRAFLRSLAGTLSSAGTLTRQTRAQVEGTLPSSGTLTRRTSRAIAGALATAGTLVGARLYSRAVGGTLTSTGTLLKRTERQLLANLATAGTVSRHVRTFLAGALGLAGALLRQLVPSAAFNPVASPGDGPHGAELSGSRYRSSVNASTMGSAPVSSATRTTLAPSRNSVDLEEIE